MKKAFRAFSILVVSGVIALAVAIAIPVILLVFGVESDPLALPEKKLDLEDVGRIKQMLHENNPRRLKADEIRELSITERDINLVLHYALSHSPFKEQLNTHIYLYPNSANVRFTYILPPNPFGTYLNISVYLAQSSDAIAVDKLAIGSLTIPGWLINPIWKLTLKYMQRHEKYGSIVEGIRTIKRIDFNKNHILLVYQWRPDVVNRLKDRGKSLLLSDDDAERLLIYTEQLAMISHNVDGSSASLTQFFRPLFRFALDRTNAGSDPVAENRALISALTIYSMGRTPERIVGHRKLKKVERPRPVMNVTLREEGSQDKAAEMKSEKAKRPRRVFNLKLLDQGENSKPAGSKTDKQNDVPRRIKLTLLERGDLALHFLVSAAITVSTGGGLADLLGLFKEMSDSRGGSGFSFADLAADRAGVKLAEECMRSAFHAQALQRHMSKVLKEIDFMPKVDHLPEGIMELEFKRKYRNLDSATYRMVDNEIKRRIAVCSAYAPL